MLLNSKQLSQIITGWDLGGKNLQQVGIDLNVCQIYEIADGGIIKIDSTVLPSRVALPQQQLDVDKDIWGWYLEANKIYEVEFLQGCKIPDSIALFIRQRSSLLRMGGVIHSSVFDPGFYTERMGTMMYTFKNFYIEYGARICQIYGHECYQVPKDALYDGQYQNDKQRNELPPSSDVFI